MAFHDVQFETGVIEPSGGPVFNTSINVTTGGNEQAQINWSYPRGRWTCSIPRGRQDQIDYLVSFFRNRFGRGHTFRFKDWSDYTLDRQSIGTTNGALAAFQLKKTYTSGPTSAERKITKPIAGSVQVWVGGVERSLGGGGSQFQVNTATGIITLGSTLAALPSSTVEAACSFDVHVRFETDELNLTLHRAGFASWGEIGIVEVPE